MRSPNSRAEVYGTFGAMLERVTDSPGLQPRLRQVDQSIEFVLSNPSARITVDWRASGTLTVTQGPAAFAPTARVTMTAAAAHELLLGLLNPFVGLDRGDLKIQGPSQEFLLLVPELQRNVSPAYKTHLQHNGYRALLPESMRDERLDQAALAQLPPS